MPKARFDRRFIKANAAISFFNDKSNDVLNEAILDFVELIFE